jgi:hypothetical protein
MRKCEFEVVRRIVGARLRAQREDRLTNRRIDQRTVARNAKDDVGRHGFGGASVALEHVTLGAAKHACIALSRDHRERLTLWHVWHGTDYNIHTLDRATPHEHMGEDRLPIEALQNLAWQAVRTNARLHDRGGDIRVATPSRHLHQPSNSLAAAGDRPAMRRL